VRMPNHETALGIISGVGTPILGPSANFHGESTPYQLSDINPQLYHLVDYVVPGICSVKKESTVIDCSVKPWKILRQGSIALDL
jgi:L-threonylcarbamoyladenylate synthase